jgi:hypothetical protein
MHKVLAILSSILALYAFAPTAVVFTATVIVSADQANARGSRGGGRANVHRQARSSGHRGGGRQHHSRDHRTTRDVNHGRSRDVQRQRNSDRSVNREREVHRNIDRDVNIDRDIDIDVDHDWDPDGFWAGAAVGAATAAVIGSVVYALPSACGVYTVGGIAYQECGGVWYAPRYQGSNVVYVVIDDPR